MVDLVPLAKRWRSGFSSHFNFSILEKMVLVIFISLALYGCHDYGADPKDSSTPPPPPLPDDAALYVSMDDADGIGLWILSANTLELIETMPTRPGVPWTIEFSPDYTTWYSCWGGMNYSLYSGNVRPLAIQNSVPLQYSKHALVKSADQRYLVAYGYKGIDVFARANLNLVHQDTSSFFGQYSRVTASPKRDLIYFTRWENRQLIGFGIYDLDLLRVTDSLLLFDSIRYPGLEDADLVISPDDRFLFLSAWNWRGGGGFNSFFVIDISQKRILAEYPCGQFARLAVSPDGKTVYISRAGFNLYLFPPDNHRMYRYDVLANTINDFLNRGGSTGIVTADDNRTVFISDASEIKKVDATTGVAFGTYSVPLDSLGYLTRLIRNIRLGKYPTRVPHMKRGGGGMVRK
jgi:hypothetical protein